MIKVIKVDGAGREEECAKISLLGMFGIINVYSRREVYLEVGVGLLIGTTGKFLGGAARRKERGISFSRRDECPIGEYRNLVGLKWVQK